MLRLTEIKLPLDHTPEDLSAAILAKLGIPASDLVQFTIYRRGFDARKRSDIQLVYSLDVEVKNEERLLKKLAADQRIKPTPDMTYQYVAQAPTELKNRPVVIGMGPCGFMAALTLAQMGFKPIVLERGKAVRDRTQDTWDLWRQGKLDPESNVQFGEGGAGTFSDGKLHSQIKDPKFHGRKVLQEFIKAGAPEEIMYISKPHIGTFRLVSMVEKIREEIIALGGEIRFSARVDDITSVRDAEGNGHVTGVKLASGEVIATDHVVLAVGHSARDTFEMLYNTGVYVEAKPFSIGVRIEHPQAMIDKVRFGKFAGHPILGAADYKLVHHASNGRTAYSFCMCPGGTVVAAASEEGCVVTNGMSQYSRNERNANSGLVVNVTPEEDFPGHPLAGIAFQRELESLAFIAGGSNYNAPVQRVGDFLANKPSTQLGHVTPSYTPGVTPTNLRKCLPKYVVNAIREALPAFDRQITGYAMEDAILTGVETRTSSPVRVKRGDDFQSINTRGLYPAGEGAGYAGGIFSAGVDGIKVAEAVALDIIGGPAATGGARKGEDWS